MNNITEQEFFLVKSSSSKFTANLNIDKNVGYTHIAVCSCSIPKTYWCLPVNATLVVTEGIYTTNITFQAGNFSSKTFLLYLATVMKGTQWAYNFVSSSNTIPDTTKYTYAVTGNGDIQPSFLTSSTYLARMMGINVNTVTSFVGNSLTSPNSINFQSYDEILVKSDMVRNRMNLLQEVYSNGDLYNSSILWQNQDIYSTAKLLNTNVTNLYNFSLQDVDNNLIGLNGNQWSLVICVFKVGNLDMVVKKFIELIMMKEKLNNME